MKKILYVALLAMFLVGCDEGYNNNPSDENSSQSSSNDSENDSENDSGDKPDDGPFTPAFSVSANQQVIFSPGNLQYNLRSNQWRFAENQFDYLGEENGINRTPSGGYSGWIDLFSWSTSATNFGVEMYEDSWDCSGSFIDWGTNIGNDQPNTWRTLTKEEWEYIRYDRANATELFGVARVNNVNGLIFLPDNWSSPKGLTFKSGFHSSSWRDNQSFSIEQWALLEKAGAIFLPATGELKRVLGDINVSGVQYYGAYWSSSAKDSDRAYHLYFFSEMGGVSSEYINYGYSVRLVKDLQ